MNYILHNADIYYFFQLVGIPGMSGPMISQVGRHDPALMQYAMQSFGTLNLSEEDWKKAEDHYKVIIVMFNILILK